MIMENNGKMNLIGGLDAWSMNNAKSLTELERQAAADMHNKMIDAKTKALNDKIDNDLEKAKQITEKMNSMEIMPMGGYVLVKPYNKNPYEKIEVTKSGLVIPEYDGTFKNPDTGEDDTEDQFSRQATVIEVGPLVKWLKPGDDIYYRLASGVPIPFFRQGFEVVHENNVQCVINEGVKTRWANVE